MSPRRLITASWWSAHAVGVSLMCLALCSVSVTWYSATQQRRITECQARYNRAFVAAIIERNEAASDDRRAMIDLSSELLNTKSTRMERYLALQRYNATLRASDAKRAASPLPTNPYCE